MECWLTVSRDWNAGTLTISPQAFAENTATKFGVSSGRKNPLEKGLKLDDFDKSEIDGDWPFRELVGCFMWLANQTRPDIANAIKEWWLGTRIRRERYTGRLRLILWSTFFHE